MSLLVRPAPLCSQKFLMRPNTYALRLPTGSDFYFSLPFNRDWLRPLRPLELAALRDYLSDIIDDVTDRIGHIGTYSVLDIRHEISARLSSADQLTEVENRAWAAGHGFPLFHPFHGLTSFFWDWNAIHFECGPSVVAWYTKWLYDFQHKPCFERYAVRRSLRFEENRIVYDWWVDDGQVIIKWYCNRDMVCVKIHGASFRDFDEWKALETQLETYELDMLRRGAARLRNAQNGGWELVVFVSEGQNGDTSDTTDLEHAYDSYPPAANPYSRQSHFPEELFDNSNPYNCLYNPEFPSEILRKHPAKSPHTINTWKSQPHPPPTSTPSQLLNQIDALANAVRNLESRLSHINKTPPPPPQLPPYLFPKPLTYPTKHTVPPPPPTPIFPCTTIREDARSTQQPYQAYAEDEDRDDGATMAKSWRDI